MDSILSGKRLFCPVSGKGLRCPMGSAASSTDCFERAFFSVGKNGFEGAAYTYYATKPTAIAPPEPPKLELHFDRPFVFAVMRGEASIFIGLVNNPTAK